MTKFDNTYVEKSQGQLRHECELRCRKPSRMLWIKQMCYGALEFSAAFVVLALIQEVVSHVFEIDGFTVGTVALVLLALVVFVRRYAIATTTEMTEGAVLSLYHDSTRPLTANEVSSLADVCKLSPECAEHIRAIRAVRELDLSDYRRLVPTPYQAAIQSLNHALQSSTQEQAT